MRRLAQETFCALIPGRDVSCRIQHDDGIVRHVGKKEMEEILALLSQDFL